MNVVEASFSGTFKTILILVIAWMVLRMFLRYQRAQQAPPARRTNEPQRPPGEVRIERTDDKGGQGRPGGSVVDADFEEIK
jgi:hypothetical protein